MKREFSVLSLQTTINVFDLYASSYMNYILPYACIIYICMCLWIPVRVHGIHKVSKQMKAFGDRTPFFRGDDMAEWSRTVNFLRCDRCCSRIESSKCLFHLLHIKKNNPVHSSTEPVPTFDASYFWLYSRMPILWQFLRCAFSDLPSHLMVLNGEV